MSESGTTSHSIFCVQTFRPSDVQTLNPHQKVGCARQPRRVRSGMTRSLTALLALLLPVSAHATDLRVYPSFAEVRQEVILKAGAAEVTFPRAAWEWVQPSSLSWAGAPLGRIHTLPLGSDWLATQEGQPVSVLRPGMPALRGVLVRAEDLTVKLDSGEFITAQRSELAFASLPPADGLSDVVRVRLEASDNAKPSGQLSYRTLALSWQPRYELRASGAQAALSALADIRNLGPEVFAVQNVDLYAGDVRMVQNDGLVQKTATMQLVSGMPVPVIPGASGAGTGGMVSLGEVRGLQRYTLPGGLSLNRLETLTVPFLQPKLSNFLRYERITSYFEPVERSGRANRHYKFTPDLSMPTGIVDVREDGALVGSVPLPAAQAGRSIDLDLGGDPELRYTRTVKRLSQEKSPDGKILSTTYQVTFALTSTKALPVRVQVREQAYGRFVAVDGQTQTGQQINVERGVDVPAGGKASISFKLKIGS